MHHQLGTRQGGVSQYVYLVRCLISIYFILEAHYVMKDFRA